MRRLQGQDRISVPVKIGSPIGSDSPAYLALTAAEADGHPKRGDAWTRLIHTAWLAASRAVSGTAVQLTPAIRTKVKSSLIMAARRRVA